MVNAKKKKDSNSLVLAGIIVLVVLSLSVLINITQNTTITGMAIGDTLEAFREGALTFYAFDEVGDYAVNITKYLFIIMLTLLIWSALESAKYPKNPSVKWILSIIISFLSISYITPEEILAILASYTALGMAFTTLIPFMIMIFFSIELLGGGDVTKTTVQRVLLQMLVWLFFVGFLSYRIIIGIASGDMSNAVLLITGGALLISIFILIYNSWFRSFVLKIGSQLRGEAVRDAGRLIAAQRGKRPK